MRRTLPGLHEERGASKRGAMGGGSLFAPRSSLFALLLVAPLYAENWSLSFATGPFIFGDFAESRTTIRPFTNGDTAVTHSLSAATRAGGALGLERYFNQRLSARFEATFTQSPLAVKAARMTMPSRSTSAI